MSDINIEPTDLFEWANKTDAIKRELNIELFLFNKNYTPYSTRMSAQLLERFNPQFLYDLINDVNLGAGTGLQVVDIENVKDDTNVVWRTDLGKVGRADTLIHLIENERHDIVNFSQEEHEFKRMQGVVARYTHPTDKAIKFYVIKMVTPSQSITSGTAWQFDKDEFDLLQPAVALKVPLDSQILVTGGDIFAFNRKKFEKLFHYDYVKFQQVDKKIDELEKHYKISVPTDTLGSLGNIVRESKGLSDKILKVQPGSLTTDQIVDFADKMQLELMTDDAGAIIIMDKSDLAVFLNILNDDYYESDATGIHYLAKSKKEVQQSEDKS